MTSIHLKNIKAVIATTLLVAGMSTSACSQTDPKSQQTPQESPTSVANTANDADRNATISTDTSFGPYTALHIADAPKLAPKQTEELKRLIDELGETTDFDSAFQKAELIEEIGLGAAPRLVEVVNDLELLPRIAALRTLYNLAEWDIAVAGLTQIATKDIPERELRLAAADLLSELASPRHKTLLQDALRNVFDIEVKIEIALALWKTSKDTLAKKALYDLLTSDSENYRIKAALALGRMGDLTQASEILEVIASEPTSRGEIAQLALERESLLRVFARMMERAPRKPDNMIKVDTALIDEMVSMIRERYIYADRSHPHRLMLEAAAGMLNGLDPYTTYLNEVQMRRAADLREFRVQSLGISLGAAPIREGRNFRVPMIVSVAPGSPAARAGLRPGDQLRDIAAGVTSARIHEWRLGAPTESTETVGDEFFSKRLGEQVGFLYGSEGTSTGLLIFRDDWLLPQWIRLVHEAPKQDKLQEQMLPGQLAYIRTGALDANSPAAFKAALQKAQAAEAKGLLIDLRDTSNGSVEAAVQIASMLIEADKLVTYSMGRSEVLGKRREFMTSGEFRELKLPVTVLINRGTADAAEILAAALKDHERAKLAGQRTFGRAIVQEMMTFEARVPDAQNEEKSEVVNHALLLTTARFYTPLSDMVIYDAGVMPEVAGTAHSFEGWVYEELDDLRDSGKLDAYVSKLLADEPELAMNLAKGDGGDATKYTGLADLTKGSESHLVDQHLRWAVRRELRMRLIQAGKLKDVADLQEDQAFVEGLRELAKETGVDLTKYDEYKFVSR